MAPMCRNGSDEQPRSDLFHFGERSSEETARCGLELGFRGFPVSDLSAYGPASADPQVVRAHTYGLVRGLERHNVPKGIAGASCRIEGRCAESVLSTFRDSPVAITPLSNGAVSTGAHRDVDWHVSKIARRAVPPACSLARGNLESQMSASTTWVRLLGSDGPDHFMELVFDHDVRGLVGALDMTGFVRTEITGQPMFSEVRRELACDGFDLYADAHNHAALLANLLGKGDTNLWTCETVLVGGHRVWIEHGYGTTSPLTLGAEMRLLEHVVAHPAGLVSWSVEYGGQGYPHGIAIAGSSAAELASALGWRGAVGSDLALHRA